MGFLQGKLLNRPKTAKTAQVVRKKNTILAFQIFRQ